MSTVHLLSYNNYYNRIVKKESSLSEYQGYQVKYNGQASDSNGNTAILEGVNFVDGDYVNTDLTVNWGGDLPDYLLNVEDNVILSRWFVVGAQKTRSGQLRLQLHRDLVVDYYANLLGENTQIFVEKAIVPPTNDLIFNNEAMSFNQIKKKEILLKDQSGCPWICVYAAREDAEGVTKTYTVDLEASVEIGATLTLDEFNTYKNNPQVKGNAVLFGVTVFGRRYNTTDTQDNYFVPVYGEASVSQSTAGQLTGEFKSGMSAAQVKAVLDPQMENINNSLYTVIDGFDGSKYAEYRSLANQNIRVLQPGGGYKYYSVTVQENGLTGESIPKGAIWSNYIRPAIQSLYRSNVPTSGYGTGEFYSEVAWGANIATISFTDITSAVSKREVIIGSGRIKLMDAPYDMFCMPYSDELKITVNNTTVIASKELAMAFATNISKNSSIYDVQLLPYCPLVNSNIVNGEITITDSSAASSITEQPSGGGDVTTIGYVLHANKSTFSRTIPLEEPIVIKDYKIENETDLYRLVSPNYNGVFEFSAAKNGGVSQIQVQCTYKPFNPYVKLFPTWGRLYGTNFSEDNYDSRGLICGGDFSLPRVSSAWEEYELRNKNYQQAFDRQIQNIEVNNSVQREKEMWGIASGTLGAGVQGGVSGGMAGGPWGAVAGAAVGTATSLIGGIRDYQLNEKLRDEALDYTKDMFGYQLGNIKALPLSLSKTSAYNVDNKYIPFLEYYTCSDVEKEALRNKIKYNGMTVMAIGTMKEYVDNYAGIDPMYFKGRVIRIDGFSGDYHLLSAIADEIYKGVFI